MRVLVTGSAGHLGERGHYRGTWRALLNRCSRHSAPVCGSAKLALYRLFCRLGSKVRVFVAAQPFVQCLP
jgi:hypothetical protein